MSTLITGSSRLILAAILVLPVSGQQGPGDLSSRSLEDLMNIEVTSVSRKDQKMSQVASAIFVITQDDIRRSGATHIPDLLRMVPGMDVGQINSNTWAISARGFNHELSDKLLVLIDGRTVYTPTFGGVDWDTQDVPLENIERIEVIRGPGGTIWGANAVNGVINIITKKAKDTPGGLVTGGAGNYERGFGLAQYGGAIGDNFNYRVFAKDLNRAVTPQQDLGDTSSDDWYLVHGGFRLDGRLSAADSLTIQGDIYNGNEGAEIVHTILDPPQNVDTVHRAELHGGNILGRLEHTFSDGSDATFQFYFDRNARYGPESTELLNTLDFDFAHHLARHGRNDLVWGLGYRHNSDNTQGTIDLNYFPAAKTLHTFNSFVQDEITLKPDRLFLTLGTKLEYHTITGYDLSPTVRLAWTPTSRQTLWAAVSRAARTPSRIDTTSNIALAAFPSADGTNPEEVILFGNPKQKSEHVLANEIGYRAQLHRSFSLDVATFFNLYDNLRSKETGAMFFEPDAQPARWVQPLTWGNGLHGTTYGAEVSADWRVLNRWSLSPGYAYLEMHLDKYPWSNDTFSTTNIEGSSPQHQAQLRSHVDLKRGVFWDTSLYFVGALPAQNVPSYVRLDTQFRWRLGESTEFSVVGQNLLQNVHTESNDVYTIVNASQIKRGVFARFTWRF